jgi:hypothetical protein
VGRPRRQSSTSRWARSSSTSRREPGSGRVDLAGRRDPYEWMPTRAADPMPRRLTLTHRSTLNMGEGNVIQGPAPERKTDVAQSRSLLDVRRPRYRRRPRQATVDAAHAAGVQGRAPTGQRISGPRAARATAESTTSGRISQQPRRPLRCSLIAAMLDPTVAADQRLFRTTSCTHLYKSSCLSMVRCRTDGGEPSP